MNTTCGKKAKNAAPMGKAGTIASNVMGKAGPIVCKVVGKAETIVGNINY